MARSDQAEKACGDGTPGAWVEYATGRRLSSHQSPTRCLAAEIAGGATRFARVRRVEFWVFVVVRAVPSTIATFGP